MQLQQLVQGLQDKKIPDKSVVVTFDDGYADNLYNAKPLLERYDIPATAFITSGYIGHKREFWWDELEKLFLLAGMLPEILRLNINGRTHQWELGKAAYYSEDAYRHYRFWNVLEKNDPNVRQRIYRSLCQLLRSLSHSEQRKVLDELLAWAGVEPIVRPTHRSLSSDEEVYRMVKEGLVEVGDHTVNHPVLSILSKVAQQEEIQRSKTRLEEILGHTVTSFSYPYGTRSDYTLETVGLVRKAGFACACSNFPEIIWRFTDRFQLPRFLVRNWDGNEFFHHLQVWLRERNLLSGICSRNTVNVVMARISL
jgi:peptidoglycan/xylan/chitin deacetylase (PgdA/CDA1 family)